MTAKRFTLLEDTNGGLDTVLETMVKDNGECLTHKECCDLLNELNEENQIIKATNEEYEDALGRLEEENRHLKAFIKQLTNNCGEIVLMNGIAYNVKKILGDV